MKEVWKENEKKEQGGIFCLHDGIEQSYNGFSDRKQKSETTKTYGTLKLNIA